MKNIGNTLILTNLVGVHPSIHTKFETKMREVEKVKNFTIMTTMATADTGSHSLSVTKI